MGLDVYIIIYIERFSCTRIVRKFAATTLKRKNRLQTIIIHTKSDIDISADDNSDFLTKHVVNRSWFRFVDQACG